MKILVTGASGFIGQRLLPLLYAEGHEVFALALPQAESPSTPNVNKSRVTWQSIDLADHAGISDLVADIRPEACLHLAWNTEPGRYLDDVELNLAHLSHSLHLLKTLIRTDCQRFVGLGSCAEYAIGNEKLTETTRTEAGTIYAAAKLSLQQLGSQIAKGTKTTFCWGRLFYLYGPDEHPQRLVPAVITALFEGKEFPASRGEQWRDYLYVDDVAKALLFLLAEQATGIYNICSGEGVQIKDLLLSIGRMLGKSDLIKLGAVAARPWDPDFIVGDSSKLRALGWYPSFNLNQGLQEVLNHRIRKQGR